VPNTPRAAPIDLEEDPAMTRVDAQVPVRTRSLTRLAYAFVREHLDSVAALARVLRGDYRRNRQDRQDR
jgi:hypothetical protein